MYQRAIYAALIREGLPSPSLAVRSLAVSETVAVLLGCESSLVRVAVYGNSDGGRFQYWHKQDRPMVERINKLIREIQRDPFTGIGKPEPLKHALAGY